MAANFDSNTQIVDAGIDFRPLKPGRKQFMLWPVLAWKVLVPEPRSRSLDVFQVAILKLCGAGMTQVEAIAERIALDRDLVAFIVLQLQAMGLLDGHGRPSKRAIQLIERDEDPVPTDTVGYVFLDAMTKSLWPRFWRGPLPYAQAEMKESRGPAILSRGDEGNPTKESAWVLWPSSSIHESPPSAHAILKAARLHRRRDVSFKLEVGDLGGAARVEGGGTTAGRREDGAASTLRRPQPAAHIHGDLPVPAHAGCWLADLRSLRFGCQRGAPCRGRAPHARGR